MASALYLGLAIAGVIGLGLARGRLGWGTFFDLAQPGTDLVLGAGAGVALVALWRALTWVAAGARRAEDDLARLLAGLTRGEALALAAISALAEEIAFRGALQAVVGWWAAALLFGLLHIGPGRDFRWWTLWATTGGLALGFMVAQRGTLGAAIVAHLVVNAIQLLRLAQAPAIGRDALLAHGGNGGKGAADAAGADDAEAADDAELSVRVVDPRSGRGFGSPTMTSSTADVFARIEREKDGYLAELVEYLKIPSISTDPAYKAEVERCADWLIARMQAAGLTTEKIATAGHPLVYAEWMGAGRDQPTILFYGHYDVQPPDPLGEWRHPPFEPTVEGDWLVARGATDDKGQSYTHVKAVAATLAERGKLPVNVKFIVEGEEESGGEAIEKFVRERGREKLGCDVVVVSDTSMWEAGVPAVTYGLKGLAYFELRVQGPNRDLHSGVYGGGVTNPANALAEIIASLRDSKTGKVLIDGFYDDVQPLADWERREFAALGLDEEEVRKDLGVAALTGEGEYSYVERTWGRPTCDVHGLWSGYQGKGAKTVLPATAGCKVSFRLVADQTAEKVGELVRAHVARVAPPGVAVEVEALHGAAAVTVDATGPYANAALDALEEVWGKRPVRIRTGGAIPIVGTFAQVLEVPVLMLGFGLEEDRLHSPNEKFDIPNFYGGIRSIARLLDRTAGVRG